MGDTSEDLVESTVQPNISHMSDLLDCGLVASQ